MGVLIMSPYRLLKSAVTSMCMTSIAIHLNHSFQKCCEKKSMIFKS